MKSIFKKLVKLLVRSRYKLKGAAPTLSEFKYDIQSTSVVLRHVVKEYFLIILGVASASFGLGGFLFPNSFIDGGVVGISLILTELTPISLSIWIVIINLPFLLLGYSVISRVFAFRSIVAIFMLAVTVHFIEFPTITDDNLLIAVFGGFFLGLGIGLAIRGGSVIDGTEVLAVYISRKTSLTIGDVILIFNIMIFSIGAYVFTVEVALYAILTYLATAKTVDFVVDGIEEYIAVTIISPLSEEIRQAITGKLGRGCTIYQGKGGYNKDGSGLKETTIVYSIITRLEIASLKTEIDKIDSKAFIVMHSVKDVKGGMIKKRPFKV